MQLWPKERYRRISVLLMVLPLPLVAPVIFGLVHYDRGPIHKLCVILIALLNISVIAGILHAAWVCTYLATNDDNHVFAYPPNATLRRFLFGVWLTPLLLIAGGFAVVGWATVFAFVALIPSAFISIKLKPRMIRLAHRRKLCFDCGYDLRGNPDTSTCPECGAEVQNLV